MRGPDVLTRPLTPRAKTTLWAGGGAFVGMALGMLVVDADFFILFSPVWLLLFAGFGALVHVKGREAAEASPVFVSTPETFEAARPPLHVDFALPDVPAGYPPVLGADEPIHVRVSVRSGDEPAMGAAVRLSGALRDGARSVVGEGVTGSDGTVTFTLRASGAGRASAPGSSAPQAAAFGIGELLLEAEASEGEQRGAGMTSLSVVRYSEEIERLFAEFRQYAHASLGPDSSSDTARELAEKLRRGADSGASKALLELARIYELVAYGEREADRRLYLALVGALLTLERAPEPAGSRPVPVEG